MGVLYHLLSSIFRNSRDSETEALSKPQPRDFSVQLSELLIPHGLESSYPLLQLRIKLDFCAFCGLLAKGHKVQGHSFFFFSFTFGCTMGILVPPPWTEPPSPALGTWSLNCWTTREIPKCKFLAKKSEPFPWLNPFHWAVEVIWGFTSV